MSEWLALAQSLPLGGHARTEHDCGGGKPLMVFHNDKAWTAYCHRCGHQPPVYKPLPTLADRRAAQAAQEAADEAVEVDRRPPQPAIFNVAEWPLEARVWLFKAGLSLSEIGTLGAYWHAPTRRVVVPVLYNGSVIYWQARRIFGTQGAKYLSMPGGRQSAVPLFSGGMRNCPILTEDLLSSYKLQTAGFTGLCLMGTSLLPQLQHYILSNHSSVGVWLDPDGAGRSAAAEIQRRLSILGVRVFNIVSDRDPKLHSKREIHGLIRQALSDLDG